MNDTKPNPYVGPRTFKREESHLFFGREREALDLLSLVISERLVLFYAQSGAGKSSLINTKLIPGLVAEEEYYILPIGRVGGSETVYEPEVDNIYLHNLFHSLRPHEAGQNPHGELTLKKVLHEFKTSENRRLKQVLILDQFEELFSTHQAAWEKRKDFFVQLAQAMQADPNLWVVLVIREDYLAHIDPYIYLLPNGLRVRYYMQRLEQDAALRAVTEPAKPLRPFAEGVAERLVDDLRKVKTRDLEGNPVEKPGQYVEPVQLQVVCSSLWEKLPAGNSEITQEDIKKYVGDVNQALGIYYEERLRSVVEGELARKKGVKERHLRDWFGKQLITTGGIRNMIAQEPGGKSGGLDDDIIQEFVKKGDLVRAERRGGGTFYELTHDRLVEPILANNKEWEEDHISVLQRQAALWDQKGRSDGLILRGKELANIEKEAQTISPSKIEQEFLARCRELKAQEERDRRRNRWLVILTVSSLFAACIAVIATVVAGIQSLEVGNQLKRSESLRLAMQASTTLNGVESNPELAALLSVRALQMMYVPQGDGTLVEALGQLYAVQNFSGHTALIKSVKFSPDGKQVLTGSGDNTAKLWDAATGTEIRTFSGHSNWVNGVAFSPDGKQVLTGSGDQTAKLWDAATGTEIRTFSGHSEAISSVAFSPNGKQILTGSDDQTAKLWDAATGTEIRTFSGHSKEVNSVDFSPDGKYVLTSSADMTVKLWDAATGEEVRTFRGLLYSISGVAFSPDGKYVLAGAQDTTAKMWDTTSGDEIQTFRGHSNSVFAVAFSPDGKYVLTGSADKTAKLWDAKTGKELRSFRGHSSFINSVAFSPDGKLVLTGSQDRAARLWNVSGVLVHRTLTGHTDSVMSVTFSPDGRQLLTGSSDKTAKLWDAATGTEVRTFSGHGNAIDAVAFSADGKYVLTGSGDKTAKLWDAATGEEIHTFRGHTDWVNGVAFSRDGKYVLTGSSDNTAKLWDAATGAEIRTFSGHEEFVNSVAFSPDGKYILTGSGDNTAKLWNTTTGEEIRTFTGHGDTTYAVVFSADGKYVLTGSIDGTAKIWETETGVEIDHFSGHSDRVFAVAFSPDGKYVLTGSSDKTAKLWDVTTHEAVRTFSGHSGAIESVAFSPDGLFIVTASDDKTARVWDVDYHATIDFACKILTRDLTSDERDRYEITDSNPTCPD